METGPDDGDDMEMVKIDVKVTKQQKKAIDRAWKERGYPNRSEFVRDVLRDATQPVLTPEAIRELAAGYADLQEGRIVPLDDLKEKIRRDE